MSTDAITLNRPNNKLYVAVIHDKKYNLRLQTLNNLITKLTSNFKVEVVDKYDHESLKAEEIRANVRLENPDTKTFFDQLVRSMHVKQVSQALKHKSAMEAFVAQDTFDTLLVIEDDVLCGDNIETDLGKAIATFNSRAQDIDALFLGCPTPKAMSDKGVQLAMVNEYFRLLPTCDSYLMNKDGAKKMLANLTPIRFQLNVQYSYMMHHKEMRMYMITPNVFVNGSKYGVYVSSIEQNNKLFMNQDFNKLVTLNTKTSYTAAEVEEVKEMAMKMAMKDHPDFQYQFAVFFMRIGQYNIAKQFFDGAYKTYTSNECIMNNESEFLINYTRLFKYMQSDRDTINEKLKEVK